MALCETRRLNYVEFNTVLYGDFNTKHTYQHFKGEAHTVGLTCIRNISLVL